MKMAPRTKPHGHTNKRPITPSCAGLLHLFPMQCSQSNQSSSGTEASRGPSCSPLKLPHCKGWRGAAKALLSLQIKLPLLCRRTGGHGMELFATGIIYLLFLLFRASQAADLVLAPEPSPDFPSFPAPAPTSGADVVVHAPPAVLSAPATAGPAPTPWVDSGPLEPKEKSTPASAPSSEMGGSIPFISSSPAVPLPVGETDTATILPFSTPGSQNRVVGMASSCEAVGVPSLMLLIMLAFASLCLCSRGLTPTPPAAFRGA